MLEDYQARFIAAVSTHIGRNWLSRRPNIRLLDMGCDCSGRQLREISRLIRGEAIGINIPDSFPSKDAIETAGPGVKLVRMDGMNLQFPDASFDMVISANVIEHVPDPVRFIHEAARVLKPDGICYMEATPIWTGPRGHHIMECMIKENCPEETAFRDDGTVIPDWSHLHLTQEELAEQISSKLQPKTVQYILRYLFESNDLNKAPWCTIRTAFKTAFHYPSLHQHSLPEEHANLLHNEINTDNLVFGFHAICRHKSQNWLQRHVFWRLRSAGL